MNLITDRGHIPALCPYKYMFGYPNQGIHSYRIFGMSIVDILMTIFVFVLFSYWFGVPVWKGILFGFILGIILHRFFCVRTTIDKWLFPEE
jgi:uncharacterized membrane protein YagU involved in acid resistance